MESIYATTRKKQGTKHMESMYATTRKKYGTKHMESMYATTRKKYGKKHMEWRAKLDEILLNKSLGEGRNENY